MNDFLFGAQHARLRTRLGWIISAIPAGMLFMASAFKFMQTPEVVEGMTKIGIQEHILLLPVLATGSAILYLVPRTAPFGLLLSTGYFGGAILGHLISHDGGAAFPAVLALMLSLGYALRNPAFAALLLGRRL